jgi:hypothetical protein
MALKHVSGWVEVTDPVTPPGGGGGGGWQPGDPYPSHPIFYPPGTSPGYPGWGGSRPHPEFPIAGPPWFPVEPPVPPGGGGGGGWDPNAPRPSHPIFYPPGTSPGYPGWGGSLPHPEFPIAGPPWFPVTPPGGPQPPSGNFPTHPINTPPPTEAPPGFTWVMGFLPGQGWVWVCYRPPEATTPPAPTATPTA